MNDETNKTETTLRCVADVNKYLKKQEWKISRSQLYEHVEIKKLKRTDEGTFSTSAVDKYALKYLQRKDGSKPSKAYTEIMDRKYDADARQSMADAESKEIKLRILKGEYVPREAFEMDLTKRAIVFKQDAENFQRSNVEKIIAIVNGDPTKGPELLEFLLDGVAEWLNRYAEDREFIVPHAQQLEENKALMDDNDNEENLSEQGKND
jgi:hypothetical protein